MYSRNLPSTTALRVFECAARHLSCTAAADELGLSQSTVSKQLKSLQEALGQQLFTRAAHGLILTAAGQSYLSTACCVLQRLEAAAHACATPQREPLRLKLLPSLGERWLLPRLASLRNRLRHREIVFHADAAHPADAEFLFGDGRWPGCESTYVLGRRLAVVAAPSLAQRAASWTAAELLEQPLIEHVQARCHWDEWGAAQGSSARAGQTVLRLGYYSLVIQAAVNGLGWAIVPRELVAPELATGSLVSFQAPECASRLGYYFVHRRPRGELADLQLVTQWLADQEAR